MSTNAPIRSVFDALTGEAKASWSVPLIAASLAVILVVIAGGMMKVRLAQTALMTLPPDFQYWSPDMQQNYQQAQQATVSPALIYVLPLLGALLALWLGWLIQAGILHLGSTLLGGRGSMGSALNVVAWAGVPFILRDVLRAVYVLAAGHPIQSAGLSGFVTGTGMLYQLLARVDVFLVWNIVLLVIGLHVADGLPKGKAIAGGLVVVLILVLAQAGMAALGSGFGAALSGGG